MELWIARDRNGGLWGYENKPTKDIDDAGEWNAPGECEEISSIDFPKITWENEEPTRFIALDGLKVKLKKEIEQVVKEFKRLSYLENDIEKLTDLSLEEVKEKMMTGELGFVERKSIRERIESFALTELDVHKDLSKDEVIAENVNAEANPIQLQSNHYLDILNEMKEIHEAKNADYGSSFDKSLEEDGLLSAKIRMKDKLNRFSQLIEHKANVVDESLEDTLIDLANYAVMTVAYIRKQEDDQQGKQHPRITAKNVIDTYYNGVNPND